MNFKEFKHAAQHGKEEKIESSSVLYRLARRISICCSWLLIRIFPSLRPNHISLFNILLILTVYILAFGVTNENAWAIALIQLALIFLTSIGDKIDGEIARFKNYFTQRGIYYDRVYHFLFPAALYFSVGYFFYVRSGQIYIILLSVGTLVIMTLVETLGKIRHHIKYKIFLEGHAQKLRDVRRDGAGSSDQLLLNRIIYYFVFLMYDWVWALYCIIVLFAFSNFDTALILFVTHATLSVILGLHYILWKYPKNALFTEQELMSE